MDLLHIIPSRIWLRNPTLYFTHCCKSVHHDFYGKVRILMKHLQKNTLLSFDQKTFARCSSLKTIKYFIILRELQRAKRKINAWNLLCGMNLFYLILKYEYKVSGFMFLIFVCVTWEFEPFEWWKWFPQTFKYLAYEKKNIDTLVNTLGKCYLYMCVNR